MTKLIKEDVGTWFEQGIYTPTSTIYIGGEINAQTAEYAIKGILLLKGRPELSIILNTEGGDVTHGLAIYDTLKSCGETEVTITVVGECYSIGAWILQAGDRRVISPNAELMIHTGTDSFEKEHLKTLRNWVEFGRRREKVEEDIILDRIKEKHPTYTRSRLKKLLDFDTLLTAQGAVDLGLADEVLS
jgi:ATP-dependent protease ClpP protease subunit